MTNNLPIVFGSREAKLPSRTHTSDAGLDLYSVEYKELIGLQTILNYHNTILSELAKIITRNIYDRTFQTVNDEQHKFIEYLQTLKNQTYSYLFDTGIKVEIPDGYVGLIWDKSSMGINDIKVAGGVIDSGYRDTIKVQLINLGQTKTIKNGQKIAQLLIQPVQLMNPELVTVLNDSSRGIKGFGSTGQF